MSMMMNLVDRQSKTELEEGKRHLTHSLSHPHSSRPPLSQHTPRLLRFSALLWWSLPCTTNVRVFTCACVRERKRGREWEGNLNLRVFVKWERLSREWKSERKRGTLKPVYQCFGRLSLLSRLRRRRRNAGVDATSLPRRSRNLERRPTDMQTFSDDADVGFDSLPSNNIEKMASMCSPPSHAYSILLSFSLSPSLALSHSRWNALLLLLLLLHFEKGEEIEWKVMLPKEGGKNEKKKLKKRFVVGSKAWKRWDTRVQKLEWVAQKVVYRECT